MQPLKNSITLSFEPNTKHCGFLTIPGCDYPLPTTIVCGTTPGPTVLITGGVHNAEYVGMQAALELASELQPADLAGNAIIIPLINRSGLEHRTMSLTYEDEMNLNRVFPGEANGTPSQQLAWYFTTEIFPLIDYFIDLHCGDGYEGLTPYVYCQGNAEPSVCDTSLMMAKNVDVPYIVRSTVGTGGAYNQAGTYGIPGILLERGCMGRWSVEEVAADKADVRRILAQLHILSEPMDDAIPEPVLLDTVTYLDAPDFGFWYPNYSVGDLVTKDTVVGGITDYLGNPIHTCIAPHDGIILYQVQSLGIIKDGPMITIAQIPSKEVH